MKADNEKASYRRVVTAEVQGKSVIQSDQLLENYNFKTRLYSSSRLGQFIRSRSESATKDG